ncbi:hypothetical protein KC19_10G083800, partial [Ceratodon purpureus]
HISSFTTAYSPLSPIRGLYVKLRSSLQDMADNEELTVSRKQLKMGSKIAAEGQSGNYGANFEGDSRAFVSKVFNDDTSLGDLKRLDTTSVLIMISVETRIGLEAFG